MKSFIVATVLGFLAASANAHMEVTSPAPFRSRNNPWTTDIDYSMTNPLSSSGSDFPCKGYHKLLDTPQGRSVANWTPGQSITFNLAGSATHNGGSCQASLSYDRGATWTAIHSYIGNCPLRPNWSFVLPSDVPKGSALFAWSWWNQVGNREMYMNCAHVTIGGGRTLEAESEEAEVEEQDEEIVARDVSTFAARPPMFVANVGNGCSTLEGSDVLIPNPGPNVSYESSKTAAPVGNCGARKVKALKA